MAYRFFSSQQQFAASVVKISQIQQHCAVKWTSKSFAVSRPCSLRKQFWETSDATSFILNSFPGFWVDRSFCLFIIVITFELIPYSFTKKFRFLSCRTNAMPVTVLDPSFRRALCVSERDLYLNFMLKSPKRQTNNICNDWQYFGTFVNHPSNVLWLFLHQDGSIEPTHSFWNVSAEICVKLSPEPIQSTRTSRGFPVSEVSVWLPRRQNFSIGFMIETTKNVCRSTIHTHAYCRVEPYATY